MLIFWINVYKVHTRVSRTCVILPLIHKKLRAPRTSVCFSKAWNGRNWRQEIFLLKTSLLFLPPPSLFLPMSTNKWLRKSLSWANLIHSYVQTELQLRSIWWCSHGLCAKLQIRGNCRSEWSSCQLSFPTDIFYCNYYFLKTGIHCKLQGYLSSEDVLHSCSEVFEEIISFYVFTLKLKPAREELYYILKWCVCNAFQFLSLASLRIFFKLYIYKEELFSTNLMFL